MSIEVIYRLALRAFLSILELEALFKSWSFQNERYGVQSIE